MKRTIHASLICLALALGSTALRVHAECASIPSEKKAEILQNLATRFKLGDPKLLSLKEGDAVGSTCYRSIVIEGGNLQRKIALFISPDNRFVFGSLADVTADPLVEARQEAERVQRLLRTDKSPRKGAQTASVMIVEFGDLQCPYCKQFDALIKSLPAELQTNIQVVYKHLPLQKHAWAFDAALATSCAAAQSDEAFWQMQDEILREQQDLTALNFREQIAKIAARLPILEPKSFSSCIDNRVAESIVKRDMELAQSLSVYMTPTLFINGKRESKLPSLKELLQWITEAAETTTELAGAKNHK